MVLRAPEAVTGWFWIVLLKGAVTCSPLGSCHSTRPSRTLLLVSHAGEASPAKWPGDLSILPSTPAGTLGSSAGMGGQSFLVWLAGVEQLLPICPSPLVGVPGGWACWHFQVAGFSSKSGTWRQRQYRENLVLCRPGAQLSCLPIFQDLLFCIQCPGVLEEKSVLKWVSVSVLTNEDSQLTSSVTPALCLKLTATCSQDPCWIAGIWEGSSGSALILVLTSGRIRGLVWAVGLHLFLLCHSHLGSGEAGPLTIQSLALPSTQQHLTLFLSCLLFQTWTLLKSPVSSLLKLVTSVFKRITVACRYRTEKPASLCPPAVQAKSLYHWTTWEVPKLCFFIFLKSLCPSLAISWSPASLMSSVLFFLAIPLYTNALFFFF